MSWVAAENERPGTRDWRLRRTGAAHEIEGYADHVPANAGPFAEKVTGTLLRAFAAGPAGLTHPAHDNLRTVRPYKGYPIGPPGEDRD